MINDLFYAVDQRKTFSKIQALNWANGDISKIHFYAMDSAFDSCDWARPKASWESLLRARCQQLRDQYDYLCLWFSGGWDSTTVLNAFAENSIKLDEVCIYQRKFIDDNEPGSAALYAAQIKNHYLPDLKITFIDIDHTHCDSVYGKYQQDWIMTPGCNLMFPKLHRWFLHNDLNEVQQIKKIKNRNRVDIEAHDKPRVLLYQNRWYCFFPDVSLINYMGADVEMFYITPSLPELHISQVHMSIDYMEQQMSACQHLGDETFSHRVQNSDYQFFKTWNLAIGRSCTDNISAVHGMLKSTTGQNPISLESQKLAHHSFSSGSQSYKIYQQGLSDVYDITGIDVRTGSVLPTIMSKQWFVRGLNYAAGKGYQQIA